MPAHSAGINVSAAASLKEVVTELTDTFVRQNPGIVFQNNFGGSGALAKQIENGAPADLFLSANLEWMDYLKEKKMIDEKSISTFAYNELVFVGKPELKVRKLRDVVKLEKIAIGSQKCTSRPVCDGGVEKSRPGQAAGEQTGYGKGCS